MITINSSPNSRHNIEFKQKIYDHYGTANVKLYSLYVPNYRNCSKYKDEQFIFPMPEVEAQSSNSFNKAIDYLLKSFETCDWDQNEFLDAIELGSNLSRWYGTIETSYCYNPFKTIPWHIVEHDDSKVIEYVANGFSFFINPNIITAYGYSFYNLST